MAKYPLEKCSYDDPDACEICISNGTVTYRVVPGTKFCPRHGGPSQKKAQDTKRANQYRLTVWQNRLDEFTESDTVKSLRDEIGILRIVLEEMMNKCHDKNELLMYSAKISDLASKIEKLVTACDRLERNMGEMLDKPTALKFAASVVDIIGRHVDDVDVLDKISHEILEELRRQ